MWVHFTTSAGKPIVINRDYVLYIEIKDVRNHNLNVIGEVVSIQLGNESVSVKQSYDEVLNGLLESI